MAARLREREGIEVRKTRGDVLELRVLLDGREIADWSGRAWPMPATVLAKSDAALSEESDETA